MAAFRGLLVMIACFALVLESTEAGWLRRGLRKIGRALRKVGKAIKKPLCKIAFGLACPAAVNTVGGLVAGSSAGIGASIADIGVGLGNNWCRVRKSKCKRSVDDTMADYVIVPFSHKFSDFDTNCNKEIAYEEFIFSVMRSVPLYDPEDLVEAFMFADLNEDRVLDTQEFMGAPFIFNDMYDYDVTPPEQAFKAKALV